MSALTPAQLVALWEKGSGVPEWRRALAMIDAGSDSAGGSGGGSGKDRFKALRKLPLGKRNARLLAMRRDTIGPDLRAFVKCPNCSEPLEFEQSIGELLDGHGDPFDKPKATDFAFEAGGVEMTCRLHDSSDLEATASLLFEDEITDALIDRAVIEARMAGEAIPAAGLSEEVRARISEELEQRDPLAHPAIPLGCAACDHVWKAPIDVPAFFWTEIERQVRAVLDDVVTLARGYGWRENDILEMGASRRQLYLDALE